MVNTGKNYEIFVASLQQALFDAEEIVTLKGFKVEVDKKIVDNCGMERQFDIYWEYELAGITYKTVIECKDYSSSISVEKIDALIGKIRDIPDIKPVFATKKGYQSGAKKKAEQNKIDLLIVREQNDSDWVDENGTPLIKEVSINVSVCQAAYILDFQPKIDFDWAIKNMDINYDEKIDFSGLNNEIFIEDVETNEKYSLCDLGSKLRPLDNESYGVFEKEENFTEAFLLNEEKDLRFKILNYKIKYEIPKPVNMPFKIDYAKELIGVIQYLQKGTKKVIFKNGVIR